MDARIIVGDLEAGHRVARLGELQRRASPSRGRSARPRCSRPAGRPTPTRLPANETTRFSIGASPALTIWTLVREWLRRSDDDLHASDEQDDQGDEDRLSSTRHGGILEQTGESQVFPGPTQSLMLTTMSMNQDRDRADRSAR